MRRWIWVIILIVIGLGYFVNHSNQTSDAMATWGHKYEIPESTLLGADTAAINHLASEVSPTPEEAVSVCTKGQKDVETVREDPTSPDRKVASTELAMLTAAHKMYTDCILAFNGSNLSSASQVDQDSRATNQLAMKFNDDMKALGFQLK